MLEVDVIAINSKGICVAIKRMKLDEWYKLPKQKNFTYKAYEINFHSFVVGK